MPAFSQSLEGSLHKALEFANDRHHEYATLEHLLLALIDDRHAAAAMTRCKADLEHLRHRVVNYLDNDLGSLVVAGSTEAQPTTAFQRTIHRAVVHVQSSGRDEVRGDNVLIAMFGERESPAVSFLNEYGLTRFDLVQYVSHGIAKNAHTPAELSVQATENFKYACPECGVVAWAERDIRLICGSCHRRMRAGDG
jgi:ATP-dependent Clp protease ATP-binding subunit ClpA